MAKRKTAEQKAAEALRYEAADRARTPADFEPFYDDPNQNIRTMAAMNPHASAEVLGRFARDTFWGVKMEVARHRNVTEEILRSLVVDGDSNRGVVDGAARKRLEAMGLSV